MLTFKQYLAELMVDIDPAADPNDTINAVRQAAQLGKTAPQRVAKQQADKARAEQNLAQQQKSPTSALEVQIARKKQELLQLQQRLLAAKKTTGA